MQFVKVRLQKMFLVGEIELGVFASMSAGKGYNRSWPQCHSPSGSRACSHWLGPIGTSFSRSLWCLLGGHYWKWLKCALLFIRVCIEYLGIVSMTVVYSKHSGHQIKVAYGQASALSDRKWKGFCVVCGCRCFTILDWIMWVTLEVVVGESLFKELWRILYSWSSISTLWLSWAFCIKLM